MTPTEKRCPRCETIKPIAVFQARVGYGNPRGAYCNQCADEREQELLTQIRADLADPLTVHPSIQGDHYMTVSVSRRRTAFAESDDAVDCPRHPPPCGVCAGMHVRCIYYRDDSGDAWRQYRMEFLCEDCRNYTTWRYDD